MRVISGKYKGKNIEGFNINGTRPTMDRVKESLFGTIQNYVRESVALDLFAGSGSLGIEALSNGAKRCYFVDNGYEIKKILKRNLTGIEGSVFIDSDYQKALTDFKNKDIQFDIIFLDPPYFEHLINNSIKLIKEYNLLAPNGIIICEFVDEKINDLAIKSVSRTVYNIAFSIGIVVVFTVGAMLGIKFIVTGVEEKGKFV